MVPVAIDASASVATASELRNRLLDAFGRGAPIEFDVSQASGCDTATAQLLIAAVRAAAQRDLPVTWRDPTRAFADAARRLGVGEELGLDAAVSPEDGD